MLSIVNYIVRFFIIIIGIIFVSGAFLPENEDTTLMQIMGIVFILFGIYRIVMYKMKSKQYQNIKKEDNDE